MVDTVKPGVPEVLQLSYGTEKELPLTESPFVTQQAISLYCREIFSTVGKLACVYSHDRNQVLI